MGRKYGILAVTGLFLLMPFSALSAKDGINVTHEITSAYESGDYQNISLQLTIDNLTDNNFHRVKLLPSGNEFSVSAAKSEINVGYLPSMGKTIVQWTVKTPLSLEYFTSGMPVFFVIDAKQHNGENIEIPVFSHGGETL